MNGLQIPQPQSSSAQQPTQPGVPQNMPVATASDPKEVLTQAIQQVESVIAQTPSSPLARAEAVHKIKAAYLKIVHGIELPS